MKRTSIIILLFLFLVSILYAGYVNINSFTEVDPGGRITKNSRRVTSTDIYTYGGEGDTYVYYDYGAGYFSGDFTFYLDVRSTSCIDGDCNPVFWLIANILNDEKAMRDASADHLLINYYDGNIYLLEIVGADIYFDGYNIGGHPFDVYLVIERDETVGTYGTLYCEIYSDRARTVQLDVLSLALHEKEDFRYLYLSNVYNIGGYGRWTGYVENFSEDIPKKNVVVVQ